MTNKIHNLDCLLGMKQHLSDSSIDFIMTSPPYDNLRKYDGYDFDFKNIAAELFRVIKQGGVMVWVVGDSVINGSESGTSFKQALYFKELGFNLHDTMIYEKNSSTYPASSISNRYTQIFEYMFILSKGKPTTHNLIQDKPNKWAGHSSYDGKVAKVQDMGVRTNIWRYITSKDTHGGHPAVFPEDMARDHILT